MRSRVLLCFLFGAIIFSSHAQTNLTWTSRLSNLGTYAIGINPLNSNIVYTEYQGGLYISYDAGVSWNLRGSGFSNTQLRTIHVNPLDTNVILIVSAGMWKSADAGKTWREVLPGVAIDGESIDYDHINPKNIYFTDFYNKQFYISSDTGSTWTVRSTIPFGNICTLASDPNNPNIICVGAGDTKIARSTDTGFTWTMVKGGNEYFSECPKITWDKTHPGYVYGAIQLDHYYSFVRSTDYGATWSDIGIYNTYMWSLDVDPVSGDIFLGAFGTPENTFEGVFRSADQGRSWQRYGNIIRPNPDTDIMNAWMMKVGGNSVVYLLNHPQGFSSQGQLYTLHPGTSGKVSGLIKTSNNNIVGHAYIIVQETGDSIIVNNAEGTYTAYLPAGNYTLKCYAYGQSQTVNNVVITNNSTTAQNFTLPVSSSSQSITGTLSNVNSESINYEVTLYGRYGNGAPLIFSDTVTNTYTFSNLSSLEQYDSILIVPLTLPYLETTVKPIATGQNYSTLVDLADVLVINDRNTSANTYLSNWEYYRGRLNGVEITASAWHTGRSGYEVPTQAMKKTKRKTVLWLGRAISTPSTEIMDSLSAFATSGGNMIIGGQNIVENGATNTLFSSKLGIGFFQNYNSTNGFTSSTIQGFTANTIGNGLNFSLSQGSYISRDALSLTNAHAFKALRYGTSAADSTKIAGAFVDNTGAGGRATVFGFELLPISSTTFDSLMLRSMRYVSPKAPAGSAPRFTTAILQNPAASQYADIVVASENALKTAPIVRIKLNNDSSVVAMSALVAQKIYKGSITFSSSGTYHFYVKGTSTTDVDSIQTRTYNVALAKPSEALQLSLESDISTLYVRENTVLEPMYFTGYSENENGVHFGPARVFEKSMRVEMVIPSNIADFKQAFIYKENNGAWEKLPTYRLNGQNKLSADVQSLGHFKVMTDVNSGESNIEVNKFALNQNYPNPFNPTTTIVYDLLSDSRVSVIVYNLLGQRVRTLVQSTMPAGRHHIVWDGTNESGKQVASGIYLYRLQAGDFIQTRKMLLVK